MLHYMRRWLDQKQQQLLDAAFGFEPGCLAFHRAVLGSLSAWHVGDWSLCLRSEVKLCFGKR